VKIEWLDATFNSARLTRGWIWKEQAIVLLNSSSYTWKYQSGRAVDDAVGDALARARMSAAKEAEQALLESDWTPVGRLPPARVVVMKGAR
jgi:hypothetical protein